MKLSKILSLHVAFVVGTVVAIQAEAADKPLNEPNQMDKLWQQTEVVNQVLPEDYRWFQEAKFAMFIHWGLYSQPGGIWQGKNYYGISEWLMSRAQIPVKDYEQLAKRFNPVKFDADAIAKLAEDAGMKYIVITAKHHEGFAMFHSSVSRYNIVDATPFGRDPMKELADACKKHGLKLGFYYSQSQDWHEKDATGNTWDFDEKKADFQKYFREKAIPQVRELLTNYGDIGVIWFDTPVGITKDQVMELRNMVKQLQPHCLINSRIGQGLGDFTTLGDNEFPDHMRAGLWESIDTLNNSWAFSKLDINWKSDTDVIQRLVHVLCKGGNFLFNIGPKGDGSLPDEPKAVLSEVGRWVHRNAEAIYGTSPVEMGNQTWIEATQRPGRTYLFVREWPTDGRIWLPGLQGEIDHASILINAQPLAIVRQGDEQFLQVPTLSPDPKTTVIVLEHAAPIAFHAGQWVVPGLTTEFLPYNAQLDGVTFTRDVRWMEIFGDWHNVPVLQAWAAKNSNAKWDFFAPETGQYFLDLEYSCDANSDLKEGLVGIDGAMHNFVPVYTGDTWSERPGAAGRAMPRFMLRRVGMISIPEKGKHILSIMLNDQDKGGWIRLSGIRLTPVR